MHRLWQHAQDLHRFMKDEIQRLSRARVHRLSPLTKKLCANYNCWQRKNGLSLIQSYWVHQPHFRVDPCPRVVGQHKINSMTFFVDFFGLILFCLHFFVLLVFCLYILLSNMRVWEVFLGFFFNMFLFVLEQERS